MIRNPINIVYEVKHSFNIARQKWTVEDWKSLEVHVGPAINYPMDEQVSEWARQRIVWLKIRVQTNEHYYMYA